MDFDYSTYISLASIAGIFVGFAALITASDDDDSPVLIKGIVNIGMLTLAGSLIPILLAKYGIEDYLLWRLSSGIFFALIWFSILHPTTRKFLLIQFKINLKAALFFWIFVEIPIQLPLILSVFGIYPNLHNAFFITSIILNLIQAGYLCVQFVHSTRTK
jgi:hypothetical protein